MGKFKSCITPRNVLIFNLILIMLIFLFNCTTDEEEDFFNPVAVIENFISPLPQYTSVPDNNELTREKISLGRQLFWDPILSGNRDVACATCHHPDKGYADALDLSIGFGGIGLGERRTGTIRAQRNAHTVLNTAFNGITINNEVNPLEAPMFWDNRAMNLEEQALLPLLSKEEMRGENIPENELYEVIVNRLDTIPEYKQAFQNAFGTDVITTDRIAKAIASFERTLVATNSPFDRYMRGDETAMTQQQINGMNAFVNVGCAECHRGPMFSDFQLHTLGVPDNPKLPRPDASTGAYAFRTPTLRNLAFTAPYMHNGMQTSLEEVMIFYEEISEGDDDRINANLTMSNIDPLARELDIDDDVAGAIIAFMEALNDPNFDRTIPTDVPSGLPVGGNINN
ncbi:MAG: cytochrome c peroxidase [Bacteroidota bacterium]